MMICISVRNHNHFQGERDRTATRASYSQNTNGGGEINFILIILHSDCHWQFKRNLLTFSGIKIRNEELQDLGNTVYCKW